MQPLAGIQIVDFSTLLPGPSFRAKAADCVHRNARIWATDVPKALGKSEEYWPITRPETTVLTTSTALVDKVIELTERVLRRRECAYVPLHQRTEAEATEFKIQETWHQYKRRNPRPLNVPSTSSRCVRIEYVDAENTHISNCDRNRWCVRANGISKIQS